MDETGEWKKRKKRTEFKTTYVGSRRIWDGNQYVHENALNENDNWNENQNEHQNGWETYRYQDDSTHEHPEEPRPDKHGIGENEDPDHGYTVRSPHGCNETGLADCGGNDMDREAANYELIGTIETTAETGTGTLFRMEFWKELLRAQSEARRTLGSISAVRAPDPQTNDGKDPKTTYENVDSEAHDGKDRSSTDGNADSEVYDIWDRKDVFGKDLEDESGKDLEDVSGNDLKNISGDMDVKAYKGRLAANKRSTSGIPAAPFSAKSAQRHPPLLNAPTSHLRIYLEIGCVHH